MSSSREQPPDSYPSAEALCRHGDELAIFHPIRTGLTQTSVEPGVPKTDKRRALGTGSSLSPFSHTPADGGQAHPAQPSPKLHPGKCDPNRGTRPEKASEGPVLKFASRWCQALIMCLLQVNVVSNYNGALPASYTTSSCTFAEGCRVKLGRVAFFHNCSGHTTPPPPGSLP